MKHLTTQRRDDKRHGMENFCRRYLLNVAKKFAQINQLSIKTVSRRFHGAVSFLDDFAAGEVTITLRKYDEMIRQFKREWPQDKKWPELPAK